MESQLTFSLNITNGEDVAGYQAIVLFDSTALRYVESAYGNYLPADAFFGDPIVHYFWPRVILAATVLAGVGNGDGTLATLTFEVVDFKASTLTLSQLYLVDLDGKRWEATTENGEVTIPPEPAEETVGDINRDGVVNIQDLVIVSARFGQRGHNDADVNGDGLVDIADLVLVAGEFGGEAAAPSAQAAGIGTTYRCGSTPVAYPSAAVGTDRSRLPARHCRVGATPRSVNSTRDHPSPKLSEPVQSGDVDTVSVGGGRFCQR